MNKNKPSIAQVEKANSSNMNHFWVHILFDALSEFHSSALVHRWSRRFIVKSVTLPNSFVHMAVYRMTPSNRLALTFSLALHVGFAFFLFHSAHWIPPYLPHVNAIQPIIEAAIVPTKALTAVSKRIPEPPKPPPIEKSEKLPIKKPLPAEQQKKEKELKRIEQLKKQEDEKIKQAAELKKQKILDEKARTKAKLDLAKKQEAEKLAHKKLAEEFEKQKKAALAKETAERAEEKAKQTAALAEKKRLAKLQADSEAQALRREQQRSLPEIDRYRVLIREALREQWRVPDDVDPRAVCQLLVRLAPGGDVLAVSLLKSSGDAMLDHSAKTAVMKASPLPVPDDSALFDNFRELRLTVRPQGVESML